MVEMPAPPKVRYSVNVSSVLLAVMKRTPPAKPACTGLAPSVCTATVVSPETSMCVAVPWLLP